MLKKITVDYKSKTPIYLQIASSISKQIEKNVLPKDFMLPSINVFNEKFSVSRDTVEKAYKELKKERYISSVKGKGYFVTGKKKQKLSILLVLNKLSFFKKIVYYSFLEALGDKATVELKIHHYNPLLFKEIIENSLEKYDYYVIMPHFEEKANKEEYMNVIKRIPKNELLLLDKAIDTMPDAMAVFQDFRQDIYDALDSLCIILEKYNELNLVFPEYSNHPPEIIEGVKHFCKTYCKKYKTISNAQQAKLCKGQVYIVIEDDDLAALIKKIRSSGLKIGEDVGVISFNETQLKELLEITVISTDFEQMGRTAAGLLLKQKQVQVKNPFKIYKRASI